MKLSSITGRNINGNTFVHGDLKPFVVFTGPNGSGKSTRLAAIMLAIFGYHPLLPRTNGAIMDMADGAVMQAGVSLSDGSHVTRTWTEKAGSTSCAVVENLKAGLEIPPMAFDHREFFNLSGPDQMRTLFKFTKSPRNLGSELVAKVKVLRLKEHDAAAEQAVAKIVREVVTLAENDKQLPWPEWLDTFSGVAKKSFSAADAAADRMASTLEGLAELRAKATATIDTAAERELAGLNRMIGNTASALQSLEAKAQEGRNAQARVALLESTVKGGSHETDALRRVIAELEQQCGGISDSGAVVAQQWADVVERHTKLAAQVDAFGSEIERSERAEQRLRAAQETLRDLPKLIDATKSLIAQLMVKADRASSVRELQAQAAKTSRELGNHEAAIRLLQASVEGFDKQLLELSTHAVCPFCQADSPDWRAKVEQRLAAKRDEARDLLGKSGAFRLGAQRELDRVQAELEVAERLDRETVAAAAERGDARERLRDMERDMAEATAAVAVPFRPVSELRRLQCEAIEQFEAVEEQRAQLEQKRLELEQAAASRRLQLKQLADARARLDELMAEEKQTASLWSEIETLKRVPVVPDGDIEALRAELKRLQDRVPMLTVETRKASASKGEAATRLAAAEQALVVSREAECWKQVRGVVDALKSEAVKEGVSPVLERANVLASRLLETPLCFHSGRIGRMGPRRFIPIAAFCDSDQLLAYSSVAVALAWASNCPAKVVLMDRMESIEPGRKRVLCEVIQQAIASGAIAQFIGCDVRAGDYAGSESVDIIPVR